jgi:hypothetical protein
MCTSRFEIESEQLALLEEYISTPEIQTRTEDKAANKVRDSEFNPISDTEEDPLDVATQPTQPVTAIAFGKRPRQAAPIIDPEEEDEEDEENEEDEIPLPDNNHLRDQSSTQRRKSGRVTKRSKQDDGQWEYPKP